MEHCIEIKVRGYHLDLYSHVNNARYLEFLEEARWAYFESHPSLSALLHSRNLSLPLVNININYRNPACLGNLLRIATTVKKVGNKSAVMDQRIYITDRDIQAVDAEVTFVLFDNATGRAVEIPDEIRNVLRGMLS